LHLQTRRYVSIKIVPRCFSHWRSFLGDSRDINPRVCEFREICLSLRYFLYRAIALNLLSRLDLLSSSDFRAINRLHLHRCYLILQTLKFSVHQCAMGIPQNAFWCIIIHQVNRLPEIWPH
jgi:hypothetical protein